MPPQFQLDQRLRVGPSTATVRYLGSIEGQAGTWAGLEWDDPAKGKHNGVAGDKRYFQCRGDAAAGSFVRLAKLLDLADVGVDLLAAVRDRYQASGEEALHRGDGPGDFAADLAGRQEVHEHQARLELLEEATLASCRVSSVGTSPGALAATLPRLRALDLSNNLLPSWTALLPLTMLPSLQVLVLSGNWLAVPPPSLPGTAPMSPPGRHFASLTTLVLNRCGLSFQQALLLDGSLPALTELHLCHNDIEALQDPGTAFQRLQVLDLAENRLAEWGEVARLGALPALRQLILRGNRLHDEYRPPAPPPGGGPAPFPALRSLLLGDNRLASWGCVDALGALPALADLTLSGNPVLAAAEGGGRFEVIARLSALTQLNASAIKPHERKDSELRYLRGLLGREQGLEAGAASALRAAHPNLQELQRKYDVAGLAPAAATLTGTGALKGGLLEVTLVCACAAAAGRAPLTKKLPGSITVAKLRSLCAALFRLPPRSFTLAVAPPGATQGGSLEGEEGSSLQSLDIRAGSTVTLEDA